jgi:hypothetical protein
VNAGTAIAGVTTDTSDFQSGPGSMVGFTQRITLAPICADNGRRLQDFLVWDGRSRADGYHLQAI